jgi:hypothetical protein
MALWTPANLPTPALGWGQRQSAVWSGSNLSSWKNEVNGVSGTLVGTPVKGAALNGAGTEMVRFNNDAHCVRHALPTISSGKLYTGGGVKLINASAASAGMMNIGWAVQFASFMMYLRINDATYTDLASANGWNNFAFGPSAGNPAWRATTNRIADTNPHIKSQLLGSTNRRRIDGVNQTLADDWTGAVPTYTTPVVEIGRGQATSASESLEGDMDGWYVLDYDPAGVTIGSYTAEEYLDGWAAWNLAGDGSTLPTGHPFKSAAPTTSSGISGAASITFGALSSIAIATLALKATVSPTLGTLTSAATSTLAIDADASATLGVLTLSATGGQSVSGSAALTLGALTLGASSALAARASADVGFGALTSLGTGVLFLRANAAGALGNLTSAATGVLTGENPQTPAVWTPEPLGYSPFQIED